VRVAFLGPAGTFSQEALLASPGAAAWEAVPQPSVYDAVLAVHDGAADRALVPIENSLEGSVNATLDALAFEADDVVIVGELVHPVRQCLIAREAVAPESIRTVVSHPQASGQCARFIRTRLGAATVVPAASTADAVRLVAEGDLPEGTPGPHAALGNRLAAELYGCEVILDGIEDAAGNATRFIWVAPRADAAASPNPAPSGSPDADPSGPDARPSPPHAVPFGSDAPPSAHDAAPSGPAKTSLVFWGAGSLAPGWLVRCLSEFAFRGVNLTRIESRPLKQRLGSYVFFLDCEGHASAGPVADAIEGLRGQAEVVRVLGSYPVAP
jgi:prephenate dehydratase